VKIDPFRLERWLLEKAVAVAADIINNFGMQDLRCSIEIAICDESPIGNLKS